MGGDLPGLLSAFDRDPAARGSQFERVCKWFLENDPTYAAQLETVWLWNDWPDRWGPDAGIDLVARARDGQLWAIQAKAYDPATTVTKANLDTFLSESSRPQFTYRLLIATTDHGCGGVGAGVPRHRSRLPDGLPARPDVVARPVRKSNP